MMSYSINVEKEPCVDTVSVLSISIPYPHTFSAVLQDMAHLAQEERKERGDSQGALFPTQVSFTTVESDYDKWC